MQREIESLINDGRQGAFLERPAIEVAAEHHVSAVASDLAGRTLGRYEIVSQLGAGGMGEVYRARDTRLKREVALKVLPPKWMADAERKRRFEQEARAASALNHPNIVTIHEIDQVDGVNFIAMEYVAGKTLDQVIPKQGLPVQEALKYAIEIAGALAAAHGAGIVHRDIKPSNVMVTGTGQVKVLDFGLAKLTEAGSCRRGCADRHSKPGPRKGQSSAQCPTCRRSRRRASRSMRGRTSSASARCCTRW